jgi:lincosamide nucleotidyltransferase A/C/D/E
MEAEHVLELLESLDAFRVGVWLDGGWGVDALLGAQRRPHDDLDVLVQLLDVPRLEEALAGLGYEHVHGEAPQSFEMTDAQGRQVDVHPIEILPNGDAIYSMAEGGNWVYPCGSLTATGRILGRDVRCQTPEMQLLSHSTGYELDAIHQQDVRALRERFGLE